jgi:pilus assembly protein Flp/PilA
MPLSIGFISAWLQAKTSSERAASLVEYALLVALISAVCIAAVTTLGSHASTTLNTAATSI